MSFSPESMEPEFCPHCGSPLPQEALFCRECGASDDAGWQAEESSDTWVEEDEFDYDDFVAREFGHGGPASWRPVHYVAVLVILVLLVSLLVLAR